MLFRCLKMGNHVMAIAEISGESALDTGALLRALKDLEQGDFNARLPVEWTGLPGKIADVFNSVVEQNQTLANELARLSRVVGKEGRIAERAVIGDASGSWADTVDSVNKLVSDLVHP